MLEENKSFFETIKIIQKYLRKWEKTLKSGSSLPYKYELAVKQILELVYYGADY